MKSIHHNKIVNEDLIERYLMQNLTRQEETAFEEHLLLCSECRKELHRRERIIAAIEHTVYQKNFEDKQSGTLKTVKKDNPVLTIFRNRIFRIAASIIFLVGLGGLVYLLYVQQPDKKIIADETETGKENQQNILLPDSLPVAQKPVSEPGKHYNDGQSMDFLAENYTPHPLYEQMVDNLVRSVNNKMIEPVDSVTIFVGQKVQFVWEYDRGDELELIILTNKGELMKEMKSTSPVIFQDFKQPGLFYWKLDTREETVAAGKIYVRRKINHQ